MRWCLPVTRQLIAAIKPVIARPSKLSGSNPEPAPPARRTSPPRAVVPHIRLTHSDPREQLAPRGDAHVRGTGAVLAARLL